MPRIMPTLAWICIFLGTSRPITGRTSKFPMNSSASRMSSPYHGLCLTGPDCCRGRSGHRGRDCVFQEVPQGIRSPCAMAAPDDWD